MFADIASLERTPPQRAIGPTIRLQPALGVDMSEHDSEALRVSSEHESIWESE